ncbi:MAG: hypothetical protein HUJ68_06965, partial [Clostridia bacterium]|nr:hypothetical protein [Clostridia bacterium]
IEKIEKYLRAGGTVATTNYVGSAQTNNKNQEQKYVQQNKAINSTTKNNEKKVETKTKKYPNKSEQYWPEIVNDLKQSGKIVLYTNLVGTTAREINDMTVGIEFPRGITAFGKTILEKQENIREISKLVSIACGKEMQIKYMSQSNNVQQVTNEDTIRNIADKSEIPFNII